MFLLVLIQGALRYEVGLFDSIENGRHFISMIPGYKISEVHEDESNWQVEQIELERIPHYIQIQYGGYLFPITRLMFTEEGDVDVEWLEIPYFDSKGHGMIDGETRVDAYMIANQDVETYIEAREFKTQLAMQRLIKEGYEVERSYFGSEDGEAIIFRRPQGEWQLFAHLDPLFVEQTPSEEVEFIKWIECHINE